MKESSGYEACRYCGSRIAAGLDACPECRRAFFDTCSICRRKIDKVDGVAFQKLVYCRDCLVNDTQKAVRKTSYELRRNVFFARFVVNTLRRRMLERQERRAIDG